MVIDGRHYQPLMLEDIHHGEVDEDFHIHVQVFAGVQHGHADNRIVTGIYCDGMEMDELVTITHRYDGRGNFYDYEVQAPVQFGKIGKTMSPIIQHRNPDYSEEDADG